MFTLIIPLVCMGLMSMNMERLWLFYNMLQLLGNTVNMKLLYIPANSLNIMQIIYNITFFKLFEQDQIKNWFETNFKFLFDINQTIGPSFTYIICCTVCLGLILALHKILKDNQMVERVKEKMMW